MSNALLDLRLFFSGCVVILLCFDILGSVGGQIGCLGNTGGAPIACSLGMIVSGLSDVMLCLLGSQPLSAELWKDGERRGGGVSDRARWEKIIDSWLQRVSYCLVNQQYIIHISFIIVDDAVC